MAWSPSLPSNYTETSTGGGNYSTTATGEDFITGLDLYKPNEIVSEIYNRHGHEAGFRFMLSSAGKKVMASQPTVAHYEAGLRTDNVKIGTTVSGSGAGTSVVLNLHADAMYNVPSLGQSSYPRVNDILLLHDGKRGMVTAKDTTVTPHRITVRPTLTTVDLSTSVTNGDSYAIIGNAHGEGTGLPTTVQKRYWKYTSGFQIVKEAFAYTGSALSNAMRLVPPSGGTAGETPYLLEIHDDTLVRYEIAMDRVLLFADEMDNITTTSNILNATVSVNGTKGMDTFARDYGHQYGYTIGSFALADFDELAKIYEGERMKTRTINAMLGFDFGLELENALQLELAASGNQAYLIKAASALYQNDMIDGQEMDEDELRGMAVEVGFKAVHKAGYTFSWNKISEFTNRAGLGATGYDYKNRAIVAPVGWVNQMNLGGSSTSAPTMFYVYKGLGNYSREMQLGVINGVGSQSAFSVVGANSLLKSNQYDGTQVGMVSEIGFHMALPNGLVYIQPS
jgi:hypothetical protein